MTAVFGLWSLVLHDLGEGVGIEACAANQGTVNLGLVEQGAGVIGLDTAAIQDAHVLGDFAAQVTRHFAANDKMGFGGHFRRGRLAGSYRPNWLVSDHDGERVFREGSDERAADLALQYLCGLTVFALRQDFTDADDGYDAVFEGGLELLGDNLVSFAEVLPAFGVSDQSVGAADGLQLGDRGFAGIGALLGEVDVLSANGNAGSGKGRGDGRNQERRRKQGNFVKRFLIMRDEAAAVVELECKASNGRLTLVGTDPLPESASADAGLKSAVRSMKDQTEIKMIREVLDQTNWNRRIAAERLQISYKALLYKIRQYNLEVPA